MSDTTRNADSDSGTARDGDTIRELARVAVPVIIAAASVVLVVVALGSHAVTLDEITAGPDEATPYSAMEGRVPQPAQPEEPAPTF
jgi:hypothetical protein